MLTLQEDNEAAYDLADAALIDPTPNTGLPSPMLVPPIVSMTLAASTAELLRRADGTIVARVRATWAASTAAYMENGYVELAWQVPVDDPLNWRVQNAAGRDTEALIEGVREGQTVNVRLTAVNSIGVRSLPLFGAVYVEGKDAAPANVAGLAAAVVPGAVLITWTPSTDLDYYRTELRHGASYAAGTRLPGVGDGRSHTWPWPAAAAYTVWAVHYDTTGHASTPIGVAVTVTAADVVDPDDVLLVANGKNTTFYASSAPTATAVGDLWFNTTAGSERVSRWNGSAWVAQTVLGTGDVSTGQIAPGAATEVIEVTAADADWIGFAAWGTVCSITYYAPHACDVTITSSGLVDQTCNLTQFSTYAMVYDSDTGYAGDRTISNEVARNINASEPFAKGSLALSRAWAMTAGQTKTFYLLCCTAAISGGNHSYTRSARMRLEAIKR